MEADIGQLASVGDVTGQAVGAVPDEQWDLPTPCVGWSVRDLVQHLVAGNDGFAAALRGEATPATQAGGQPSPGELASAYRRSVRALLDAFREPGALERTVTVPFGTVPGTVALHLRLTELLVHGWDLTRATGFRVAFPDDLAEQELAFARPALADIPPDRRPFAPPEPVADDAPAIDRLAACLGRKVTAPPSV
ncbi:MAG: TIGR03086 family metal-binding protein [Streptosporangiaceae bacterium]